MVAVSIDGKQLEVSEGTSILEACQLAGIEVPHLCHHRDLHPYGACRVCSVEVTQGGRTKLVASCSHKVTQELEVRTRSERVEQGRKIVLELLLARSPEVPEIRALASKWGVDTTRFETEEEDDCILCGLCVRACRDVVGAEVLGFRGRGVTRKLSRPEAYDPETCIGCGLCTYVCPTGAIQMEATTVATLRQSVGTERTCRYMLMGLVTAKTCPENFQCWQCPYDQLMESALGTHPALAARPADADRSVQVGPFLLATDRSYARNHLWVRPMNGRVMVGVDGFLSSLMSPLDSVDASLERIRLSSSAGELNLDLPVSGKLVSVNPDLGTVPRLVNFSPYQRGWIAILEPEQTDVRGLLEGPSASHWLETEVARLAEATGLQWSELTLQAARERWTEVASTFVSPID